MKLILTMLTVVVFATSAFANNNAKGKKAVENKISVVVNKSSDDLQLTGTILDQASNESLAGAVVLIDGKKVYSDLDGNFTLKDIQPGVHKVKAELISYESAELEILVNAEGQVNVALAEN